MRNDLARGDPAARACGVCWGDGGCGVAGKKLRSVRFEVVM